MDFYFFKGFIILVGGFGLGKWRCRHSGRLVQWVVDLISCRASVRCVACAPDGGDRTSGRYGSSSRNPPRLLLKKQNSLNV